MNTKKYLSLSFLIIAVFLLSACNALGIGTDYEAAQNALNEFEEELEDFEDELKELEEEIQATQAALYGDSVEIPAAEEPVEVAVEEPTEKPASAFGAEPFASETGEVIFEADFKNFPDGWFAGSTTDIDSMEFLTEDGLSFALSSENDYLFAYYDLAYDSADIRLDAAFEVLEGEIVVVFNLFCRDNSVGSYGFLLDTDGYWTVDYLDYELGEVTELGTGESAAVNTGNALNTLTAICDGDQITFLINDVEIISITDDSNLMPGEIGFSISAWNPPIIRVKIHYLTVSVP